MTTTRTPIAVVAGASGYIGSHLTTALRRGGWEIRTIGRGPDSDATWADPDSLRRALEGSTLLVNLAGRSVSCRYSKANADAIFTSRVDTSAALGAAVAATTDPPALWANASTGTIYRDARDHAMDERNGELGTGFSVEVARAWEREQQDAPAPVRPVRLVSLRMTIVLGAGGGAVNPFINLVRLGLGGAMGDGHQVFSWIHVDDIAPAVLHLLEHPEIEGPVNLAAPEAVTNAVLMREVRRALGRRRGLPTPAWLLQLGARVIRTEPELVLKSRWVEPAILRESGFTFTHPRLRGALEQIAADTRPGLLPVALG